MKSITIIFTFLILFSCNQKKENERVAIFSKELVTDIEQIDQTNFPKLKDLNKKQLHNLKNWNIITDASQKNKDLTSGYYAAILESKDSLKYNRCDEQKERYHIPRIIVVANNNGIVISQNNQFVALDDEGGMSPQLQPNIFFEGQILKLQYQYTRSSTTYSFHILQDIVYTLQYKQNGVYNAGGTYYSTLIDFPSRRILKEEENIKTQKKQFDTIAFPSVILPKTLEELQCPYEWEIVENVFF